MAHETFHTPATETSVGKHDGYKPSGNVVTDGRVSTANLPERTPSPDACPEVFYDRNENLPGGVYGGGE